VTRYASRNYHRIMASYRRADARDYAVMLRLSKPRKAPKLRAPVDRERINARRREWRAENREYLSWYNKAYKLRDAEAYRTAHTIYQRAYRAKRRALMAGITT
jgi:hypothetical protein